MANLYEQRYERLIREHFTPQEAKQLASTNVPLTDPRMVSLRKERVELYWQMRNQHLPKSHLRSEIRIYNKVHGYSGKQGANRRIEEATGSNYYSEAKNKWEQTQDFHKRFDILRKAGFYPFEARELARMRNIEPSKRDEVFKSKTWQAMIRNHPDALRELLNRAKIRINRDSDIGKLPPSRINQLANKLVREKLQEHKKKKTFNPYDWLKREYKPKSVIRNYDFTRVDKAEAKHSTMRQSVRHDKLVKSNKGVFWD